MNVKFKKLSENAIIPTKAYPEDAGNDLYSCMNEVIPPGERRTIDTGIVWEFDFEENNFLQKIGLVPYFKIEGRSGLAKNNGISILGGVVDASYRGEIKVIIQNNDKENYIAIKSGDKIAQGIVYLIPKVNIVEAESINSTDRGEKGFGSSDKKE